MTRPESVEETAGLLQPQPTARAQGPHGARGRDRPPLRAERSGVPSLDRARLSRVCTLAASAGTRRRQPEPCGAARRGCAKAWFIPARSPIRVAPPPLPGRCSRRARRARFVRPVPSRLLPFLRAHERTTQAAVHPCRPRSFRPRYAARRLPLLLRRLWFAVFIFFCKPQGLGEGALVRTCALIYLGSM